MSELEGDDPIVETESEVEAPVAEEPSKLPELSDEIEGDEQDGDEDEGSEEDDDFDEIEWGGKKHRIPKDLKAAFMMQSDYTKKTQEVAEQRKALEAQRDQQAQMARERVQAIGRLTHADDMIAEYQKINWAQLEAEDFGLAQTRWREFQQWKDHREALTKHIAEDDARRTQDTAAKTAKRQEEARAELVRDIKGWDTGVGSKVAEFALSLGWTAQELNEIADPRVGKALHKAWLSSSQTKTPAKAVTPDKPLAQITKRSGSTPSAKKSLADLDMDEYVAARKAGRTA